MSDLIINQDLVKVGFKPQSQVEAIKKMSSLLLDKKLVKNNYCQGLLDREEEFPTGLEGTNVSFAIPHTDAKYVNQTAIAVGILNNDVKFFSMNDHSKELDVKIIIMLAVKQPKKQVMVLQNLVEMMQDNKLINHLLEIENKKEVVKIFKEHLDI